MGLRGRRLTPLLAVVGVAAVLAGCKSQGPERAMARFGETPPPSTTATAETASERPAAAPRNAPDAAEADSAPQTAALPDPSGTPAEVDADPDRLMGLSQDAVGARLGQPELVRKEAPAEIWQYRTRDCVLDVFFYPAEGAREVLHLDVRDAVSAEPSDAEACLTVLLRRQLARGT